MQFTAPRRRSVVDATSYNTRTCGKSIADAMRESLSSRLRRTACATLTTPATSASHAPLIDNRLFYKY